MREEYWDAIRDCNPAYDGVFVYGVATTGVFCRPSCKSRLPKPEHVRIFWTPHEAKQAHFRPCKRCHPEQAETPEQHLIQQAIEILEAHFAEPMTLPVLAQTLHISPYHLHRMFRRVTNQTPAQYLHAIRMQTAASLLMNPDMSIACVANRVGFNHPAHFSSTFQRHIGCTPTEFRLRSLK